MKPALSFGTSTLFLPARKIKKRALYFTTMTYALQNAADQATAGYNDFQSKYKGDMLADNLPAAMGSMYLALNNAPEAPPLLQ